MEKLRFGGQCLNNEREAFEKAVDTNALAYTTSATSLTKLQITKGTLPNEFS